MPSDEQTDIPLLDLTPQTEALWDELEEATQRVLRSGRFILGPEVEAFEEEVADYLGVRHAVGVNSGTDALVIALRALGLGPGDEVITTPFTFFATAESISIVGAQPVFVDVEPDTFNIDPVCVEEAVTDRTRALLPVHLFGRAAAMDALLDVADRHDLAVVEDAAQAFGARSDGDRVGTLGDAAAFSFFPSKNLGAAGDGGLIATDHGAVAEQARMLRAHGGKDKYHNEMLGYNSRLDALQAAILRVKLPHLDAANAGRRRVAHRYTEALRDLPGVHVPELVDGHVFHQYTLRIDEGRRDAVREKLAADGIQTMVYYPAACHRLPVYADRDVRLPVAERLQDEVLSLPIWPEMPEAVQERVIGALQTVLE